MATLGLTPKIDDLKLVLRDSMFEKDFSGIFSVPKWHFHQGKKKVTFLVSMTIMSDYSICKILESSVSLKLPIKFRR